MRLQGIPVSPGMAAGMLYAYRPAKLEITERHCAPEEVEREIARLGKVMEDAAAKIRALADELRATRPEQAKIFAAHESILRDEELRRAAVALVRQKGYAGDWALKSAFDGFIDMLARSDNPATQERALDLKDVGELLLRVWHDAPASQLPELKRPVVLAARDLLPSDTAMLDHTKVLAILAEQGGTTSHSAILARGYGIPAVLGIPGLMEAVVSGEQVAVDAVTGEVDLDPDLYEFACFREKQARYQKGVDESARFLSAPARTADGEKISIGLNIGACGEEELAGERYADCAGLFRTEFLYMRAVRLPDEETQFTAYRKVLSRFGQRPVALRTLDVGGDKALGGLTMPEEENPGLGRRALRFCFSHPEIFRTQLRAALRASVYGNLWLMLPMVASIDDIRRAKRMIREARDELVGEGIAVAADYKVGIMIETPSIALIADLAAAEVDFASIGTNDLCQYLMAADRLNPDVAAYYQMFHPAVFRMISAVADVFLRAGKPLSVCGEMGGNPLAAAVFVGLGLRGLSMNASSIAPVKRMLHGLTISGAESLADTVRGLATADEVEACIKAYIKHIGGGIG